VLEGDRCQGQAPSLSSDGRVVVVEGAGQVRSSGSSGGAGGLASARRADACWPSFS
jgi:hypothetical protein